MNVNMSGNTLVTVVIPVYNREQYVGEAIESVIAQTCRHWKMIIMDDASSDGTPEVAQAYLTDSRIQYVRCSENRGTGAILAEALELIETPYFVILDSDDWLDIRALAVLLHEMDNQDEATGLVFGNCVSWSESDGMIRINGVQRHRSFQDKYDFILYHAMIYPRFFRTEAVRAVGGFELDDPYGGRYMEDRYLLLKLISKYKFHYVDCHLYHHRSHDTNISGRSHRSQFEQTRLYVYPKILRQWGDEYEPLFGRNAGGWLHLQKLIPKSPHMPPLESVSHGPLPAAYLSTPKVTVVMPTYNRSAFIAESIQSVMNQSLQDWQLLIIDDASKDHTKAVVADYLSDPRVTYVRRPINGGIGQVLNDTLKLVTTRYFMQLDADDWIESHTLASLLGAMENASEDTALAYGNSLLHKTNKNGTITTTPQIHRMFENKFDVLLYRWMVVPRFYRTLSVRQVGGWDLNVPFKGRHMEDRQMFYKLAENHKFVYVDQLFYHYRLHGTNLTLSNIDKYAEIRIYLVQFYFHKWNGRKQLNGVIEWHNNAAGWPQFSMVPIAQRKKYVYYLGALTRSELTDRKMDEVAKRAMTYARQDRSIVVFALDDVNLKGRYIRGIMLADGVDNVKNEQQFFRLPQSTVYLHDDTMFDHAKKFAKATGCELRV